MRGIAPIGIAAALLVAAGCAQSDFGDAPVDTLPEPPPGPGDPAWGAPDVTCSIDDDCAPSETCLEGICQMRRCGDGPFRSTPPLGDRHYFFHDHEIVAADGEPWQGSYWIDGYRPDGTALAYQGGSWNHGAAPVLDVAGGNLLGARPQSFASVRQGQRAVFVERGTAAPLRLELSFQPVAIAAGDVDHDSIDEIIAVSAGHQVAVCSAVAESCTHYAFGTGVVARDVAAGDVDGDGYDEPILLLEVGGKSELVAWNLDHETSGEPALIGVSLDRRFLAIAAGDGDGDGLAEVYALTNGGWLGLASDRVEIWRLGASSHQLGTANVDADSRHLATADLDMDGRSELLVLHDARSITVYRQQGAGALTAARTGELAVTARPMRIAAADLDGDSPSATLTTGPELIAGEVVPTMVLYFPPYSASFSEGLPNLFVGETQSSSESFTDTVALSAGVQVGVGAEFPGGVLGSELSLKLQRQLSTSRTLVREQVIGMRLHIEPSIELHGDDYGLVVLSCACYHAYRYRIDDPAGRLGKHGGELVVVVPVAARSALWSSPRYNAMAERLGGLPQVAPAPAIGSLASYPGAPARPDGSPIREDELVFRDAPTFLVSDVGRTGWWLAMAEREINAAAVTTELGVASAVKIGGVKVGAEAGVAWGSGYALMVGREAIFGGAVPPLPDRPSTPEDEYQDHAYAFRPVVYRETYQDAAGEPAGYYVLTFSVGR